MSCYRTRAAFNKTTIFPSARRHGGTAAWRHRDTAAANARLRLPLVDLDEWPAGHGRMATNQNSLRRGRRVNAFCSSHRAGEIAI